MNKTFFVTLILLSSIALSVSAKRPKMLTEDRNLQVKGTERQLRYVYVDTGMSI